MLHSAQTAGGRLTVKRVEKMLSRAEERLAAKLDGESDRGIHFEETGIDYLFIDEAHAYKNLQTVSNIPGAAIDGSKRAQDLHLKTMHLRERHGGHVATLATATPIANSVTEAHVMQRSCAPTCSPTPASSTSTNGPQPSPRPSPRLRWRRPGVALPRIRQRVENRGVVVPTISDLERRKLEWDQETVFGKS